ncbi:clasp N terminal-domain-containing protein [Xylariales sp. PMI_506]|nr:clasp N terminal-domain-containing protein [Xylariales sp. PMI_506]
MAEKLTDQQVADLLTLLRKDVSVDSKVQAVTAAKSAIKQHNVPETCAAPLFDALRSASTAQHSVLANAGFTALNHLLTRLSRQEPKLIIKEAKHTLPLIVEKMGDPKDKLRTLGVQAMTTMYTVIPTEAERFVRNVAMVGKNARAKESGMQWLLQMHKDYGLQFRSYVPTLMELLEDADGMVRDTAKTTVIELFRSAPNAAKSDLKKQLKNFKVRPAIEAAIVKELAPTLGSKIEPESRPDSAPLVRPNLAASVSSLAADRPNTPLPETKADAVEPSYVNTQRELDDIFREMHQWFESKETEQNWLKREESMTKLRRLIAGNAATDFHDGFLVGTKALLDGILKAVNSLRTSLSKEGCALVQDLTNAFGPGIDPMVELLMQAFIKLAAATKKISSQQANTTIDIIIGRTTYTARIMQHMWGACQDKNIQPRTYVAGWIKTILKKEAHHKSHIEHSGGLDLLEKCIKKGLGDANPGVRERMRATYWFFSTMWPARAEAIMDSLDSTAQKLLQKDPNNPNSPKKVEPAPRPGLGLSKSTMGPSKPSLRDTVMAQKRALATKTLPARPGSAMAAVSPVRTMSSSSNASGTSGTAPMTRPRAEASNLSHGGMSHAPMRPARRRPEMAPRPATAGPYSGRNHDGPGFERSSPSEVRTKAVTPKTIVGSPRRTAPRPRPGHQPTLSESSLPSPTRPTLAKAATISSPRGSPGKPKPALESIFNGVHASSPSKTADDLTLVIPTASSFKDGIILSPTDSQHPPLVPDSQDEDSGDEPVIETPSKSLKVYEDPTAEDQTTPRPIASGSPVRPVLEDKPINEDAAKLALGQSEGTATPTSPSLDKSRQNSKLLESGIARVKAQTLDVHGFRKLQSLIRDSKAGFTDEKFDSLLLGLLEYLESPLDEIAPEKVQDLKAQVLATIKLLLKKMRENFQPHVSRCLEALLATRAGYDARNHIVSGLELLADELVTLGDPPTITATMTRRLDVLSADNTSGSRSLSMGLHILKQLLDTHSSFEPTESEVAGLARLALRCIESQESGVRMGAVQLCVALHSIVGEQVFWEAIKGVKDDPKSLITYYIVKRQRETGNAAA